MSQATLPPQRFSFSKQHWRLPQVLLIFPNVVGSSRRLARPPSGSSEIADQEVHVIAFVHGARDFAQWQAQKSEDRG